MMKCNCTLDHYLDENLRMEGSDPSTFDYMAACEHFNSTTLVTTHSPHPGHRHVARIRQLGWPNYSTNFSRMANSYYPLPLTKNNE